jgi:hypothetical protein
MVSPRRFSPGTGPPELSYDRVDAFVTEALERSLASLGHQTRLELELTASAAARSDAPGDGDERP